MAYTNEEMKALQDFAHCRGLKMTLQGGRVCKFYHPTLKQYVYHDLDRVLQLYRLHRRQKALVDAEQAHAIRNEFGGGTPEHGTL